MAVADMRMNTAKELHRRENHAERQVMPNAKVIRSTSAIDPASVITVADMRMSTAKEDSMPKITLDELQAHAEEMYRMFEGNAADQAPWALVLATCLTKGTPVNSENVGLPDSVIHQAIAALANDPRWDDRTWQMLKEVLMKGKAGK